MLPEMELEAGRRTHDKKKGEEAAVNLFLPLQVEGKS